MEERLKSKRGSQIEQTLSQRIETLYRTQLGHKPSQVSCKIVDEKIAIFVENSITQPEQLLAASGEPKLAEQVRSSINKEMRLHLKKLIEEVVQVPVIDLLIDSAIATGRTSTIAVLATTPLAQDAPSISALRQQLELDGDSVES